MEDSERPVLSADGEYVWHLGQWVPFEYWEHEQMRLIALEASTPERRDLPPTRP